MLIFALKLENMDDRENNNGDIFIESIKKYRTKIEGIIIEMDNETKETKNPLLGKIVNTLKLVYTSMENPYVLEELDELCSLFVAKQLFDHFDEESMDKIREMISENYNKNR